MRILKFNVEGQKLRKDPDCDFSNINRGSVGYLGLKFKFDGEWDGLYKAAEFQIPGKEETYPVLLKKDYCELPAAVSDTTVWSMKLIGKKGDKRIPTNKLYVRQEG